MKKSKKNNYHTILPYTELHEESRAESEAYKNLSKEEIMSAHGGKLSFTNYFNGFEAIDTISEYYQCEFRIRG